MRGTPAMAAMRLRAALAEEVEALRAIERDAATLYATAPGHAFVAALRVRDAAARRW